MNKRKPRREPATAGKNKSNGSPRARRWASLRDLEVFRAVIESRGITSAARQLAISQPAVSRSIATLEDRSGRLLFNRDGHTLIPTSEALALYDETHLIFDAYTRLDDFRWGADKAETLTISTSPTIATCFLSPYVARFVRDWPRARISLEIVTLRDTIDVVRSGKADIGVIDPPAEDIGVAVRPLRRSHLVVALPKSHPFAERTRITADDLRGQPIITWVRRNPIRAVLDRVLWREGEVPNVIIETSNAVSVLQYVREGLGVAIVNPFPIAFSQLEGVIYRLLEPQLEYDTSIITPLGRPLKATAQRFIDFIAQHQPAATPFSRPL
jgi:DNA-binding transcriptional LysR family regulator